MRSFLAVAVLAALISGCTTTSGLDATTQRTGFDGATIVNIEPHGNSCVSTCTNVAAQWNSSKPESAILTIGLMQVQKFSAIQKVSLRINQKVLDLQATPGLTNHRWEPILAMHLSNKGFTVPISTVREIVSSQDVWLRISTDTGFIDDAIIDSGKDSKGFNALKRFLAEVDKK